MTLFHQLNTEKLCQLVRNAQRRVAFIGPALTQDLAAALVSKHIAFGDQDVTIILDYNEEIFRLGYGEHAAIEMLREKHIPIRRQSGMRISALLVDDHAWVLHQSPMAVEDPNADVCNAITLQPEQVSALARAVGVGASIPDSSSEDEDHSPEDEEIGDECSASDIDATIEIGRELLPVEDVKAVKKRLDDNPPQAFDLQRHVKVYTSLIQFVEVEFEGGRIEQSTIKLPARIRDAVFGENKEIETRLSASYRLLDSATLEGLDAIKREVKILREFTKSLNKRLGSVMLRSRRKEFMTQHDAITKQIENWKKGATKQLESELKKSVDALIEAVVDRFLENPPHDFFHCYPSPATRKNALEYLQEQVTRAAPNAEKLVGKIHLHCTFKDVTYEMLKNDKEFITGVCKAFPVLQEKLLNESDAAYAQTSGITPDLLNN